MPIVTISRGSMSGGKALAECISTACGAPCIGREIVMEAAARLGVSEQLLAAKMEKGPRLWERFSAERRLYVAAVQAALAEHAATGNLVYHGLAGHLLLRAVPGVLRVRLIAPILMRVRAVMEQQGLPRDDAERYIEEVDKERVRWTRFMYGVDVQDPRLYDLVLNLESMSIPSACALVVEATRRPEFLLTDEVRAKLADFVLACRVTLALASAPVSRGLELEVTATAGVVKLKGELRRPGLLTRASGRWEAELGQVVTGVEGVKGLVLEVELFDVKR